MRNQNAIKFLFILIFVSLGAFVYWILYDKPLIGIDDANIYFIYMRNFADGYGFVYTMGGERVEGFTSLLWTLIGSIFFKISSQPEILLLVFNILLVSFTLWQVIIFIDELFEDKRTLTPSAYFLSGTVFLLPGYFDWTILSLLETGIWSCLLISSVITLCRFEFINENNERNNYLFAGLLILLVLCRPESYLWGFSFLIIRYWQLVRRKSFFPDAHPFRKILFPLFCFSVTAIAITTWRLHYFGYPLPNTYYAKISADHLENFIQGMRYDYHFFKDNFFPLLIGCFSIIYFIDIIRKKNWDEKKYASGIMIIFILIALLVPIYTGGDHFKLSRFIHPVAPLFYLLFVLMVAEYIPQGTRKIKTYIVISVSFFALLFSPAYNLIDYTFNEGLIQNEFKIASNGRKLGSKLTDFFNEQKPFPTNGLLLAGGEAYTYKGESIDVLGLNTVSIAHASSVKRGIKNHSSFDKECFYGLAPDIFSTTHFVEDTLGFVIIEKSPLYNNEWFGELYKGIFTDKKFRENYLPVFIFKKGEKNILHTYANNNFLSQLDTTYYLYSVIQR